MDAEDDYNTQNLLILCHLRCKNRKHILRQRTIENEDNQNKSSNDFSDYIKIDQLHICNQNETISSKVVDRSIFKVRYHIPAIYFKGPLQNQQHISRKYYFQR